MKESNVVRRRILKNFFNDILKLTLVFFSIGVFMAVIVSTWRFNPFVYFIAFIISFSVSFVLCFLKKETHFEFKTKEV